ncbi:His/Glu/Gln/Arg/opine family amino acid ABC transporter permease subunit [Rhodoferax ferrireducens]|uniref:His/Glu/Gln/Arg/opine family amino acid ABC transporter permease subunit n=1 Tax=Rhodoferax ferrireducens TaxID=192843 RepID=A0ABU2C8A6_9BURK|nr:amino acid ABC transporter permease [Rhodoferax ferrireducens]MDR7377477.1 His/Glu/Gln/Arg/opine family amino acid ABC transporter permease subunit [Rhodoferax ferrireducens]
MTVFFMAYLEYLPEWLPRLARAAVVTAQLSAVGFIAALLGGAALVAMLRSGNGLLRHAANLFIQALRTVPLLALLLALYFALPPLGITLSGYWAGALGLGLHGAAYVAEIFRGGLNAIHKGQREAALAVGLAPRQVFIRVVLPQALRLMLPPLLNTYVALLKDSSLCALIATDELMLTARAMASEFFLPLHIFLLVGLFYFGIAFPLSMLSRLFERRLARGRRVMGAV